jgi:hypothetical protein
MVQGIPSFPYQAGAIRPARVSRPEAVSQPSSGILALLRSLSEKYGDPLPGDAEEGGDLLHGHALGVQGSRLGSAQPAAGLEQTIEVLACDLLDQGSLVATEDLAVGPPVAAQAPDRLCASGRDLVAPGGVAEYGEQGIEGLEHIVALSGFSHDVPVAVADLAASQRTASQPS